MIKIEIQDDQVSARLAMLRSRLSDMSPVMRMIAGVMHHAVEENFAKEGRPKWKLSARAVRDSAKTLQKSGRLAASITEFSNRSQAMVGTNVIYAAIHQFGGKTRPHIILPKNGKALFWPGARHPVKSVNHPGSNIPARPFLALADSDWKEIRDTVSRYLTR